MPRCRVDQSIKRTEMAGFAFPLGVYPVEPIEPKSGYTTAFEPADDGSEPAPEPGPVGGAGGGPGGEWEEWPDRYVYDILVPAARVEPLCRTLFSLLPGRIFPILDFLGQDEWREVDPYVSYDLLGMDRFLEALRRFRGFFFDDGLIGFGAMSEEPFIYVFVDEHKVVTVRAEAELKEKVEKALAAFDLEPLEELLSADSVTHEHRTVLETADDRPDLLNADEIVELLRDEWRLVLNIDPETNLDEEGKDLGLTDWRCILRCDPPALVAATPDASETEEDESEPAKETPAPAEPAPPASPAPGEPEAETVSRYAEVFLVADSYHAANDLALEALEGLFTKDGIEIDPESTPEPIMVVADRWNAEDFAAAVQKVTGQKPETSEAAVVHATWLN